SLVPNLGVVDMGEGHSFVVADLPGLIEGAADGAGLGHRFLRHLDRCRVLVHLVAADDEGEPVERMRIIEDELAAYDPELASRTRVVALSKIDLLQPDEIEERLAAFRAEGIDALALSAVSGAGVPQLLRIVWDHLASSLVTSVDPPADDS
ncbi:MAG: 50S ribosome-binding GTPase, partial [Myxococcales bacterium]|nr:50S ribosome-binding GTPase [Myxococcales bacterium]